MNKCTRLDLVHKCPFYVEDGRKSTECCLSVPCIWAYEKWKREQAQTTKPPIGIIPRIIWLNQRKEELMAAIHRYREAGLDVPQEWRDECVAIRAELDRGYYTV